MITYHLLTLVSFIAKTNQTRTLFDSSLVSGVKVLDLLYNTPNPLVKAEQLYLKSLRSTDKLIKNQKIKGESYHLILKKAKFYSKYSGAVYCKDENIMSWSCGNNCIINTKPLLLFKNIKSSGKGYLAVNKEKKKIILAFRGSVDLLNWIENLQILRKDFYSLLNLSSILSIFLPIQSPIEVHSGFYYAAEALYYDYIDELETMMNLDEYEDYNLVITGHSLGAAIATVTTMLINTRTNIPFERMELFTYGQPRVGNLEFTKFLNNSTLRSISSVNKDDLVPAIPFAITGYYRQHHELWVKDNTTTILCSNNLIEDPECSNSLTYKTAASHYNIWDTNFSEDC